jgi:uncharacterized protein (DUF433 family)
MDPVTIDFHQMGGVPCIRGLRIPVTTVLNMIASGMTQHEITEELPLITVEDIHAALRFAADTVAGREILLRPSA